MVSLQVVGMYEYISIMILITSSLCIGYYDTEVWFKIVFIFCMVKILILQ